MRGRAGAARRACSRSASAGRCARRRSARSPTRSRLRVFDGDELVGDMPVDGAGRRRARSTTSSPSEPAEPLYPRPAARGSTPDAGADGDAARAARLAERSRRSASSFEQYDSIVGSRTVRRPEAADAAVLVARRRTAAAGAIAVSIDGNGRRVACDPVHRARSRRCSSAPRNLACVGAEPLGLTNCLNFGNPEKPHIAWQLTRAVEGLRDACLALGVPVVGGNVSLYNEGAGGPDLPDAGRRHGRQAARPARACRRTAFAEEGARDRAGRAVRAVARRARSSRSCAARLADVAARRSTWPRRRDALGGVRDGGPRAASCRARTTSSEGGLAVRARRVLHRGRRRARRVDAGASGDRAPLFGEGPGGVVVAGPARGRSRPLERAPCVIGEVGGDALEIERRSLRRAAASSGLRAADRRTRSPRRRSRARPGRRLPSTSTSGSMSPDLDDRDGPRDECGVFGVYAPEHDVARLAYFALYALQHRGQESAGHRRLPRTATS